MADKRKSRNVLLLLMGLSFVAGLAVIPIVFVVYQLFSIAHAISLDNAFATTRMQLSDHVWFLATGGTNVMLADSDGNGLIYGNVVMAGYTDSNASSLLVLYAPYHRDSESSTNSLTDLTAVDVDLATGQIIDHPELTQAELAQLQGIFVFMDN